MTLIWQFYQSFSSNQELTSSETTWRRKMTNKSSHHCYPITECVMSKNCQSEVLSPSKPQVTICQDCIEGIFDLWWGWQDGLQSAFYHLNSLVRRYFYIILWTNEEWEQVHFGPFFESKNVFKVNFPFFSLYSLTPRRHTQTRKANMMEFAPNKNQK